MQPEEKKPAETPLAETSSVSAAGIDQLVNDHVAAIPAADPDAVAAEQKKTAAELDPAVYAFNADGTPRVNADGTFARKRGPKPKALAAQIDQAALEAQSLGTVTAEMFFTVCVLAGGEEWRPEDLEREQISAAWGNYFRIKGYRDLPPWMVVVTASVCYAAPRLRLPETQTRLGRLWMWLRSKLWR